jgi:very-short-patch-repair endonuclease
VGIDIDIDADRGRKRRTSMLAERQHGLVTRAQLLAIGVGVSAIDHRVANGTLQAVRRGVYAVGHRALRPQARFMSAVLALGPGAVLSHASAAALWGIRPSSATLIDVTVPGRPRGHAGIRVHRCALLPGDVTVRDGIPVTTVERTILDMAAVVSPAALRRLLEAAERERLVDWRRIAQRAAEPRRGMRVLRAIVAEKSVGLRITKRELEARFQEFLRRFGLPLPATNAWIEGFEVDCVWHGARLIAELDSRRYHGTDGAVERDRARDRRLVAAGWTVIRITWRQLHSDPESLARDIGTLALRARAG